MRIYNVLYIKTIYELYIIRFKKDSLTPGFCFVCFQSFYKNSINEMYSMLFFNICLTFSHVSVWIDNEFEKIVTID